MALHSALERARELYPDRVALIYADRRWTYGEIEAITNRLGAGLLANGVNPGDRVAMLLPNSPELVFCYYACFRIGAVAVPLNARLTGPELVYMLNHCGARLLITDEALFKDLDRERPGLVTVEKYFIRGDTSAFEGTAPFQTLLEQPLQAGNARSITGDTHAAIMYTSGTTVRPKGVLHTHRSYEATIRSVAESLKLSDEGKDEVFAIVVPLYHTSGVTLMLLPALATGRTVLVLPRFEPAATLELLSRHRVNYFFALPFMYDAMARCPAVDDYDFSSLRAAVAGGDAVPPETFAAFRERFGVELCGACGMTEVAPYSFNPPYGNNKPGSIGLPSAGMSLRLVDPSGRDAKPGCVGEILVKSEAMTVGYWNDERTTRQSIVDGWLYTGDLATVDADGYYWFAGRKKEIIVRGGSNISPLEIEAAITPHPAVKEVAVTGTPHPALGEVIHAFIVLQPDQTLTADELRQFLAGRIAGYKIPELVTFLPALPRGVTGKVNRRALKRMAESGTECAASTPARDDRSNPRPREISLVPKAAIEAYDAFLEQGLAADMRAFLDRESVNRRLLFNDRPFCEALRPNFLRPEAYERIRCAAQAAGGSLAALHRHAMADSELRRVLGTDGTQEEMMLVDGDSSVPGIVGRLDGLVSTDGNIRFIEYNTVPFGVFLMDGIARMYAESPAMRRFGGGYNFSSPSTVAELLNAMTQVYGDHGATPPLNLVCIGGMPGPTMNEFRLFLECMKECGHTPIVVPPDAEWIWRDGRAFVLDTKADLALMFPAVARALVQQYGRKHPLLRAVAAGTAQVFNGLARTSFFNSKLTFSALSDPEFAHLLPAQTSQTLAGAIPWTRRVHEGSTTYAGGAVDLIPFLAQNRERFVLKPARSFGGSGVVLGWHCTSEQWSKTLSAAREQPYVVQERVHLSANQFPFFVDEALTFDDVYADLNVYVWCDERAEGCMVRLSADPILNLTAGHATAVPTFIVNQRVAVSTHPATT